MWIWTAPSRPDTKRKPPASLFRQTPDLVGCLSCFQLYPFVIVKANVIVNDLVGFSKDGLQTWRKASSLKCPKKFSMGALSQQLPRRDMEGVMVYCWVRKKYACEVYWYPWSLWSSNSAVTFSFWMAFWRVLFTKAWEFSRPNWWATIKPSNRSLIVER